MSFTPGKVVAVQSEPKNLPEISVQVSQLPSRSTLYPPKSEIKYRPFTYGEVKKLSQSKLSLRDRIEAGIEGIDCTFDKLDLTMADFLYIGLLRKLSTLGSSQFSIPFQCTNCGKRDKVTFGLETLDFEDMKAPELPVIAVFAGKDREINPITVRKYFELIQLGKENDGISIMAKQMDGDYNENYKSIYNASIEDGRTMEELDEILYHGVKPIDHKCVGCGFIIPVEVEGEEVLILPFRESEAAPRSHIRYGTKAKH